MSHRLFRFFPKKTIHVVVVDPGVGSARRAILVEAEGQYFIAPENGVLAMVYSKRGSKVREITADEVLPSTRQSHVSWPGCVRSGSSASGKGRTALFLRQTD